MKHLFYVIGTVGVDAVMADSAKDAARRAFLPGTLQDVLAVIDAAYTAGASRTFHSSSGLLLQTTSDSPIVFLVGKPSAPGGNR